MAPPSESTITSSIIAAVVIPAVLPIACCPSVIIVLHMQQRIYIMLFKRKRVFQHSPLDDNANPLCVVESHATPKSGPLTEE